MKKIRNNPWISFTMFVIGTIMIVLSIILTSANKANATEITKGVSGVSETTGVRYEVIYAHGSRFLVFSNSSGSDIEVFNY